MARKLAMLAEQFDLLPPNHFGGRPGRNTTDAILHLVQKIKDAWRRKEHAAVLFLDIAQAFPSVSHPHLIHNLRKSGIPSPFIQWLQSFLSDRTTTLLFDDFSSPPIPASHGIPPKDHQFPPFSTSSTLLTCSAFPRKVKPTVPVLRPPRVLRIRKVRPNLLSRHHQHMNQMMSPRTSPASVLAW